ncbi:hypothetical protein ACEWY4_019720 [Coilia grayii]|uniref:Ephrin RBD domain-containing protein n=1 Tax=Coilia grayii TaxID=363190 RepID=A0ABD1JAI7_9TELE
MGEAYGGLKLHMVLTLRYSFRLYLSLPAQCTKPNPPPTPPEVQPFAVAQSTLHSMSPFVLVNGDYAIQVNLNDYLDILCPHYLSELPPSSPPETLALYLVSEAGFRGCQETRGAIKRWECSRPYAPYGPVRFSEKIQRFTPFSLGFEFLPGHHYYYSSLSTDDGPPLPCMKVRVTVCCASTTAGPEQEQGTPAPRSRVDPGKSPSCLPLLALPLLLVLLSV